MKLLVILQNAWRKKAGLNDECWLPSAPTRAQALWEKALWKSLTGRRLKQMLPEGIEIVVTNASPRIGNVSSARFSMDETYVLMELKLHKPDLVLLCGTEAQKAYKLIFQWAKEAQREVSVLKAPHPAWRALTRIQMNTIKSTLAVSIAS